MLRFKGTRFDPLVEPLDRGRAGGMRIPPAKAQIFSQCLNREIMGRPFGMGSDHVEIEVDGVGRLEQRLDVIRAAHIGILCLQLPIDRPLIFGVVKDCTRLGAAHVIHGLGKCSFLGLWGGVWREIADEFLGAVVAAPTLNEAVQVAHIPHRIDFDVEEQLKLMGWQRKRGLQIGPRIGAAQELRPFMELSQRLLANPSKSGFVAFGVRLGIDGCQFRHGSDFAAHGIALRPTQLGDECQIISGLHGFQTAAVPVTELAGP